MSDVLRHRFVSQKPDGPDATQIQPSSWNDGHAFSGGAAGDVLTRDPTDAAYGAIWKPIPPIPEPVGWVAYSPKWYITGVGEVTQPGNHVVDAQYYRTADVVLFQVLLTVGSDPLPIGQWAFSFPFRSTAVISPAVGMCHSGFQGTGFPLFSDAFAGDDRFRLHFLNASLVIAPFGHTVPANLGPGWYVEMRGNYRAA